MRLRAFLICSNINWCVCDGEKERLPPKALDDALKVTLCRMQNFDPMSLLLSDALTDAFSWVNDLIDLVVGNSRKVESKIQKRPNKHCKENSRKRSAFHLTAIASRIGGEPIAISFFPVARKRGSMVMNKPIFLLFWSLPTSSHNPRTQLPSFIPMPCDFSPISQISCVSRYTA